ncbi:MAG: nucleotidyltransferase family protein [Firmicutes bacterium]|nr:nucleotidyltransferase family protein [Bacillota bacterium]
MRKNTGRPLFGIVLAAGESRRMGCPKLLLPWEGDTMIGRTLIKASDGGIDPLTVICGAEAAAVSEQAAAKGVPWLINEDYKKGHSTSLICGLQAVLPGHGVIFILGDMPSVLPQSYRALAAAFQKSNALIVAPVNSKGKIGNPTVWAPELFGDIRRLTGDKGARGLMHKYKKQTLLLPLEDEGAYTDIDTPQDFDNSYLRGNDT